MTISKCLFQPPPPPPLSHTNNNNGNTTHVITPVNIYPLTRDPNNNNNNNNDDDDKTKNLLFYSLSPSEQFLAEFNSASHSIHSLFSLTLANEQQQHHHDSKMVSLPMIHKFNAEQQQQQQHHELMFNVQAHGWITTTSTTTTIDTTIETSVLQQHEPVHNHNNHNNHNDIFFCTDGKDILIYLLRRKNMHYCTTSHHRHHRKQMIALLHAQHSKSNNSLKHNDDDDDDDENDDDTENDVMSDEIHEISNDIVGKRSTKNVILNFESITQQQQPQQQGSNHVMMSNEDSIFCVTSRHVSMGAESNSENTHDNENERDDMNDDVTMISLFFSLEEFFSKFVLMGSKNNAKFNNCRVMGNDTDSLTLLFNDEILCRLHFENGQVCLDQSFNIRSGPLDNARGFRQEFVCFEQRGKFLFGLRRSIQMIDVWDLELRTRVGSVDFRSIKNNGLQHPYTAFQVSPDVLSISLEISGGACFIVLSLDECFKSDMVSIGQVATVNTNANEYGSEEASDQKEDEYDGSDDAEEEEESEENQSDSTDEGENEETTNVGHHNSHSRLLDSHWYDKVGMQSENVSYLSLLGPEVVDSFCADSGFRRERGIGIEWDAGNSRIEATYDPDSDKSQADESSARRRLSDNIVTELDNGIVMIRPRYSSSEVPDLIQWCLTDRFLYALLRESGVVSSEDATMYIYDFVTHKGGILRICKNCSLMLSSPSCQTEQVMLLRDNYVSQIVLDMTKEQIIKFTLTFKDRDFASSLCQLNQWGNETFCISTLELHLQNRELFEVEEILRVVPKQYEVIACCVVLNFVNQTSFARTSDFKEKSILLTINFASQLLEARVRSSSEVQYDQSMAINPIIHSLQSNQSSAVGKLLSMTYYSATDRYILSPLEETVLLMNIIIALRGFLTGENVSSDIDRLNHLAATSPRKRPSKHYDVAPLSFVHDPIEYSELSTAADDPYNYGEEYVSDSELDVLDEDSDDDISDAIFNFEYTFQQQHPGLYGRWRKLGQRAVMIEALQTGDVSLAFSFLRYRHLRSNIMASDSSIVSPDVESTTFEDDLTSDIMHESCYSEISTFDQFRQKAFSLVYEFFANNQFDAGVRMLRNLGESVVEHMHEIAFKTLDPILRNQLLRELERKEVLSKEESDSVQLLQTLETIYPETSFYRVMKLKTTRSRPDTLLVSGDINDLGEIQHNSDETGLLIGTPRTPRTPVEESETPSSDIIVTRSRKEKVKKKKKKKASRSITHQGSYFIGALDWIKLWSECTKERVLVEQRPDAFSVSTDANLSYLISHFDIAGIVSWVASLPSPIASKLCLEWNEEEDKIVFTSNETNDNLVEVYSTLIDSLNKQLHLFPSLLHEVLVHSLSLRGIMNNEAFGHSRLQRQRMAKASLLFSNEVNRHALDLCSKFSSKFGPQVVSLASSRPIGQLSNFHMEFIHYCISNDLISVLIQYINSYGLWDAVLDTMKLEKYSKYWLNMLRLAHKNDIFSLSLLNAQQYLKQSDQEGVSVNRLLASSKPLLALATIMYSPVSFDEALNCSLSSVHYINSRRLASIISPYPALERALFKEAQTDMSFSKGKKSLTSYEEQLNSKVQLANLERSRGNLVTIEDDISLFDMMHDTHEEIDLSEIFPTRPHSDNEASPIDVLLEHRDTLDSYVLSDDDTLLNFSSGETPFKDSIDIQYYLLNARALDAYKLLLADFEGDITHDEFTLLFSPYTHVVDTKETSQNLLDHNMSANEILRLCHMSRRIAMNNFLNKAVTNACSTFLELCGSSICQKYAHIIQVECKVARLVFQEQTEATEMKELFLSISFEDEGIASRLKVLSLLEDATSKKTEYPTQSTTEQYLSGLNSTDNHYLSPYKLLCDLCDIYGLPMYTTHLKQLAQHGQWISLLHEAHELSIPVSVLLNIVEQYSEPLNPLRHHLIIVLREVGEMDKNFNNDITERSQEPNTKRVLQIFHTIIYCHTSLCDESNQAAFDYLVLKAQEYGEPLLAVVAVSYLPGEVFVALNAWLVAVLCHLGVSMNQLTTASKLEKLESLLIICCEHGVVNKHSNILRLLIRALRVFDPSNPLLQFILFYDDIVSCRFNSAHRYLFSFVDMISSSTGTSAFIVGDTSWIASISATLMKILFHNLSNSYQCSQLLRIVVECRFDAFCEEFAKYQELDQIISKLRTGCLMRTGQVSVKYEQIAVLDVRSDPITIISQLLDLHYYEPARKVTQLFKLSVDHPSATSITLTEARYKISQLKESTLWQLKSERDNLWTSVQNLFTEAKLAAQEIILFFINQAFELQDVIDLSELISLLELAEEQLKRLPMTLEVQEQQRILRSNISLLTTCVSSSAHAKKALISSVMQLLSQKILCTQTSSGLTGELEGISEFLVKVIDSLLLQGKLNEAIVLAGHFQFDSSDLRVISSALQVCRSFLRDMVNQKLAPKSSSVLPAKLLPEELYIGLRQYIANIDEIRDIEQIFEKLHMLCYGHDGARHYCRVISLNLKVAKLLQTSYDDLVQKDPYDTLKLLLMFGRDKLKLCSSFVLLRELDTSKAGVVCASYLFNTFCDYYEDETPTIINNDLFRSDLIEDYFSGGGKDESADLTQSELDRLETTSSNSSEKSTSSADLPAVRQQKAKAVVTVGQNQKSDPKYDIVKCSGDEFLEYASICRDPAAMASHLLQMMDEVLNTDSGQHLKVTIKCHIELVIRAYWCYQVASSLDGVESLLNRIKNDVVVTLLDKKEFSLIVRLLLCIRNFSELGYLFDILTKHEQFELILRRNPDKSVQNELKMVLASYLKQKFPDDDEKLMMVYLRFNMFKEYGSLLMKKATTAINLITDKLNAPPVSPVSNKRDQPTSMPDDSDLSIEELLRRVTEQYASAADSFVSEECFLTATRCTSLCNLVQLQASFYHQFKPKCPVVLNMSQNQARQFIRTHSCFPSCLVVAQAYDLNQMSEWLEPIYHQCIVQGNTTFFLQLRQYLPTSSNLFREIAKRFRTEQSLTPKIVRSMYRFCALCSDYAVKLEILKGMGQLNSELAYTASATLDSPLGES